MCYLNFYLNLGIKVTQNIAQYPLHHVAYLPAKFVLSIFEMPFKTGFTVILCWLAETLYFLQKWKYIEVYGISDFV